MGKENSHVRHGTPINFDNYALKQWLRDAGVRRHELLQKLQKDLKELNFSKCEIHRAWIQLTTKPYVVLTRWTKTTASATNNGDKCGKSLPLLEDSEHNTQDVRNKKDLSNSENQRKVFKFSSEGNKKVRADTTSQVAQKVSKHGANVFDSQIRMRKMKFEHMMGERRKYLLDKYKIKRQNHESKNKYTNICNNASEINPVNNKTNRIRIPVQIDRKKLKITSKEEQSEKEVNNKKNFYYKSETMEADSTVSNDKKDDIDIHNDKHKNELKDVPQHKLYQSIIKDKFQDNFNVPMIPNKNYLSAKERKRKRIKEKLRYCFDDCLTLSEEEEEESILDLCIYKRQKKDFSVTSNDSTNIEFHTDLDLILSHTKAQDTSTNLVICEDVTNNMVPTETFNCNTKKVEQVEAISSVINVIECNNNKNISDNNTNLDMEDIEKSALLHDDEGIQTNLANDKIVNLFSEKHSLNTENNTEMEYVEGKSKSKKSVDTGRNALPDSNISNENCDGTNTKELSNHGIQIRTLSEKNGSNNNCDETTCYVSQNNCIKESQWNADSGDLNTASTNVNSKILEKNVSADTTKQRESAIVVNPNFTEFHKKIINDCSVERKNEIRPYTETSKCTSRNFDVSQQNISNSLPEVHGQCIQTVSEDLSQILQMDINQNHTIQCEGNTISIQENLEKNTSQYTMEKDISINNITNDKNEISSKCSTNKTEETLIEKCSPMVTDTSLREKLTVSNVQNKDDIVLPISSDEKEKLSTDNNSVDNISPIVSNTLMQHTSHASTTENANNTDNANSTENFKQPETSHLNKIRVLSSAELGSRWCPTPLNNSASTSETDSNLPCKESTKNTELNLDSIPNHIQLTLSYIYNIVMRIRTIEQKYLSNNCQNMMTGNQKTISDDKQFKSNFTVLLQELVNLGKELQIFDMDIVVRYAISMINKHYILSQYEPITGEELVRYIEALKLKHSKLAATTPNSEVSVPNEQGTNLDNIYTATAKSLPSSLNNPNVVPATVSFIPNVCVPTGPQSHIAHNNLPKQNIYVSNVLNQNYEPNASYLQATQKSNTSISYIASMQQKYKNMQILQDNRTSNMNMPHYQRLIQQQPIPVVTMNNVSNSNIMQLKNNTHIAPRTIVGPYSIPQHTISHDTPQISQKPGGSQVYVAQNCQNTQASYSNTMSTHVPNLLPRTNMISHELAFKIWDQLTYCLEKKFVDCGLHDTYDKMNCPLQLFYKKWKEPMNNFMYQRMQSKYGEPPIKLQSQEALFNYHYILKYEKWRNQQQLLKNKEPQMQSLLVNTSNKKMKRNNLVSTINVKPQNVTTQSEAIQHKPRKNKKNANSDKQQQSRVQLNTQLLNNIVVPVHDTVSNASEKNNSLLVGSNFINLDDTTSLKSNTVKQKNTLLTDRVSLENDDIIVLRTVHRKEVSLLLPRQTVREEVLHKQKESSLLGQTFREVVNTQEENLLPKQATSEKVIHAQEERILPKQATSEKVIHAQEERILPKQATTEENVHTQEENLLPTQATTEEVIHVQEESLLLKQTTTEEVIHAQEESLLPKPTTTTEEIVPAQEKKNSLLQETIAEKNIYEKECSSLIGEIIKDNANYLQCRSIQSLTLLDPHIVDVRSISPTSFNKMENMFVLNDSQLSSTENTGNNEIKVKIEIPEDVTICLQCSKISTLICEVCLDAHYCSKECAELYWVSEHHKHCKPSSLKLSEKSDDTPMTEDSDFNVKYRNVT